MDILSIDYTLSGKQKTLLVDEVHLYIKDRCFIARIIVSYLICFRMPE